LNQVAPPARWINSERALIGSDMARAAGGFPAYHAGVFRAAYENRDISDLAILGSIAAAAGLDEERFREDLATAEMPDRITANRVKADGLSLRVVQHSFSGIFPRIGIQPKETMRMLFALS
jgi:predicted DsbA family dithiol-disulfide isomerase